MKTICIRFISTVIYCGTLYLWSSFLLLRVRLQSQFEANHFFWLRPCSHVYSHILSTSVSSASAIRFHHPLPSSAQGVHMCTCPLSVIYVEYRIVFVCLWFCIIAFTVTVKMRQMWMLCVQVMFITVLA